LAKNLENIHKKNHLNHRKKWGGKIETKTKTPEIE
jgi:hypothetical protein